MFALSKLFGQVLGGEKPLAALQQHMASPETEGAALVRLPMVSLILNLNSVPSPPIFVFSSTDSLDQSSGRPPSSWRLHSESGR